MKINKNINKNKKINIYVLETSYEIIKNISQNVMGWSLINTPNLKPED